MSFKTLSFLTLAISGFGLHARAQDIPFSPCPLLGPRFPIPAQLSTSKIIQSGLHNLTGAFDNYVTTLNGTFGPISATTSFSVILFSTESTNASDPFLFEYHHTAKSLSNTTSDVQKIDADTIYPLGDLTTLFTTWLFLIEAGEHHWSDPITKWIPELHQNTSTTSPTVQWNKITLGDLAAHLSGLGHFPDPSLDNPTLTSLLSDLTNTTTLIPCDGLTPCTRESFLSYIATKRPVTTPATTPILSNTAFIILTHALEEYTNKTYPSLLSSSILTPLNLTRTTLLTPSLQENSLLPSAPPPSPYSLLTAPVSGLLSTPHNTATALRAILSSTLLPPATTSRWLKPTSHTSNRANSVGRPWEIYSLTASPISPVIPVYQVRGNQGGFAAHVGLVPDYGVGFVILGRGEEGERVDLNAYADVVAGGMVPVLERNAVGEAGGRFGGRYEHSGTNTTIIVGQKRDASPGLEVEAFEVGGVDVRDVIAGMKGIEERNLSFRLYPVDVGSGYREGSQMVFRASFQDEAALVDAGTPTCETWRYIDEVQVKGMSLDEFVFEMGREGAVAVEVPGLGVRLVRESEERI